MGSNAQLLSKMTKDGGPNKGEVSTDPPKKAENPSENNAHRLESGLPALGSVKKGEQWGTSLWNQEMDPAKFKGSASVVMTSGAISPGSLDNVSSTKFFLEQDVTANRGESPLIQWTEATRRDANNGGSIVAKYPEGGYPAGDPRNAADTKRKFAMVIGNGAYKSENGVKPLEGAKSDAKMMAAKYRSQGYQVIALEDLTKSDLQQATSLLTDNLQDGDDAVFYYAGHGVFDGILGVDAMVNEKTGVVTGKLAQAALGAAVNKALGSGAELQVILDACNTAGMGADFAQAKEGDVKSAYRNKLGVDPAWEAMQGLMLPSNIAGENNKFQEDELRESYRKSFKL
jgi:hypothetical protein